MLSEQDRMIVRFAAYIAVLEQSLTQLQEAHKGVQAQVVELEAKLAAAEPVAKK